MGEGKAALRASVMDAGTWIRKRGRGPGERQRGLEPRRSQRLGQRAENGGQNPQATLRCGDAGQDLEGARMLENAQHCPRASGTPGVHPATGRGADQQ